MPGTYSFTATRLSPSPGQIFAHDVERFESSGVVTLRSGGSSGHPIDGHVEEGGGAERYRVFGKWTPSGDVRLLWPLHRRQIVAAAMKLHRTEVTATRQTWRWEAIAGATAVGVDGAEGSEVLPLERMEWTLIIEDG